MNAGFFLLRLIAHLTCRVKKSSYELSRVTVLPPVSCEVPEPYAIPFAKAGSESNGIKNRGITECV
jgi:hypothetical protein